MSLSIDPVIEAEITKESRKLAGVEFQGVMCSATESDQNGLLSMYNFIKAGQLSPNFHFENGNVLPLNSGNIDALLAVWSPFRESFFQ